MDDNYCKLISCLPSILVTIVRGGSRFSEKGGFYKGMEVRLAGFISFKYPMEMK